MRKSDIKIMELLITAIFLLCTFAVLASFNLPWYLFVLALFIQPALALYVSDFIKKQIHKPAFCTDCRYHEIDDGVHKCYVLYEVNYITKTKTNIAVRCQLRNDDGDCKDYKKTKGKNNE